MRFIEHKQLLNLIITQNIDCLENKTNLNTNLQNNLSIGFLLPNSSSTEKSITINEDNLKKMKPSKKIKNFYNILFIRF